LIKNRVITRFDQTVISSSEELTKSTLSTPQRLDLTALDAFTIDDESTKDMDDALSVEEEGGVLKIGIHISDVASFINKDSVLDKHARKRATSIYLPEQTIPMLPHTLSNDLLSLKSSVMRPVLSCLIEASKENGKILKYQITPAIINVKNRYSYDQLNILFDEHREPHQATLLYNFAVNHEMLRAESGASRIEKREVLVALSNKPDFSHIATSHLDGLSYLAAKDDVVIELKEYDEQSPANLLVSEASVVANMLFATYAAEAKIPFIYRGQGASAQDEEDFEHQEEIPNGPAADFAQRSKLKRSVLTTQPSYHATLGLKSYAQVTSPIRRYLDLINQRQLLSHLTADQSAYSKDEIESIITEVEPHLGTAQNVTKETKRYWILRYLENKMQHGQFIEATITRTAGRYPLVELEEVYTTFQLRAKGRFKLGEKLKLKIGAVVAIRDFIRLETTSGNAELQLSIKT
jgi:exoribonuclease-2